MYELTDADILIKLLTANLALTLPLGFNPELFFHVHSPKSALPSFANLEDPQPLSIAACANIIETGI